MNLFVSKPYRWKALILLNAVYAAAGLLWIILIPYNNAPDENTHFHYSIEFIMQHHRLPVWGVDDIERFQHALSSYNQMPALNYVVYAVSAAGCEKLFGLETYLGARLVSLGLGLIFLNFLFLAARELSGNYKNALIITAAVALIPQVFFSFCYVNAEALSLALTAILGFALVRLLRRQASIDIIFAGAAIGLLFSAKYNYYIYFPFIAVFLLLAALYRTIGWKTIGKLIIASAVLSLLISGFWFIRNIFVYGNPLPLVLSEDFFKSMALAREVQPVNHGLNIAVLAWLVRNGFIASTFDSFFAVFGYLNVGFHRWIYTVLECVIPLLASLFIINLAVIKDRAAKIGLAWLLALILSVIALHVWACLIYDYQPQGRYQFAVLIPIALYVSWVINRHPAFQRYVIVFLLVTAGLFAGANLLIVRTYGAPVQFAVSQTDKDGIMVEFEPSLYAAKRTVKNYYATEKITIGNEPVDGIKVGVSDNFLARYRDFKVELETEGGIKTVDFSSSQPASLVNARFDAGLKAVEASGRPAGFMLPLNESSRVRSLRITCRIENRRLYDLDR